MAHKVKVPLLGLSCLGNFVKCNNKMKPGAANTGSLYKRLQSPGDFFLCDNFLEQIQRGGPNLFILDQLVRQGLLLIFPSLMATVGLGS